MSPRGGPFIDVNLKSGEAKVEIAQKPNLQVQMIMLHSGKAFGRFGLIVMSLVSIIFLILTVTGFIVYLDMWKRRRGASKKGAFLG